MPVAVVEPELTSFKYDATIGQLLLGLRHGFVFNQKSQQFELDQNPFGDTNLVPMKNVVLSKDFSQLTFDARYQRKQRQFEISAANTHEKILIELFGQFNATGFSTQDDEADHVQLHFENGRLVSIEIFKHPKPSEDLTDSLHIYVEAGRLTLLELRPRRKLTLNSIEVDHNRLISRSADEEFVYTLDVQPVILDAIKRLVDSGLPPGGKLD